MFGSKIQRDYKEVLKEIASGSRREPQHKPPSSIEKDGTALLRPEHRIVFDDFDRFREIINTAMHHGPFSFEEQDRVSIGFDGPDYGRTYRIYYNAMPAGQLEIGVAHLLHASEGHGASADLSLDFAQLIPEGEVRSLLRTLWFMFAKQEDGAVMRAKADAEAVKIMTMHLWEVIRVPDVVHGLSWRFEGPYEHYAEYLSPHEASIFDFGLAKS